MQQSKYSNEEIAVIQQKFYKAMMRNRNQQRNIVLGLIVIVAGSALLYFFVPADYSNPLLLFCVAVLGIYLFAVMKMYPPLKCPGCYFSLEESFGNYCPQCGTYPLKPTGEYHSECSNCHKQLSLARNNNENPIPRNYKIRVCTRCGVTLARSGF